ncbi:MAG: protease complex subunit PrcB family protein [Gemmatimonadota bacterium]|nr:protease complex subunit PrcB family protein [Gemmatimonadota bacterium]MDH5804490.1 protease complex subunit PrcB family protein [Gemmatimonadota bacterium]
MKSTKIFLALSVVVTGCLLPTGPATEIPKNARRIAVTVIPEAHSTLVSNFTERTRTVVRDSASWELFWGTLHGLIDPNPPLPDVDFTQFMVIGAGMGTQPTTGFEINVRAAYILDDKVFLEIVETSPAPSCLTGQAVTAPFTAVIVPVARTVRFVERTETTDCG